MVLAPPVGVPFLTICTWPLPPDSLSCTLIGFAYGSFAPAVIGLLSKSDGLSTKPSVCVAPSAGSDAFGARYPSVLMMPLRYSVRLLFAAADDRRGQRAGSQGVRGGEAAAHRRGVVRRRDEVVVSGRRGHRDGARARRAGLPAARGGARRDVGVRLADDRVAAVRVHLEVDAVGRRRHELRPAHAAGAAAARCRPADDDRDLDRLRRARGLLRDVRRARRDRAAASAAAPGQERCCDDRRYNLRTRPILIDRADS